MVTSQHAAEVDRWRLRETELNGIKPKYLTISDLLYSAENERLTRQCEKTRRSLEKHQAASTSKKTEVNELRQAVQELADENETLLGSRLDSF